MQLIYFTERPYRGLAEEDVFANGYWYGISNGLFDPALAHADYNYYLDELTYAEELGFDGLALNEHHGNPFCMGGIVDVEAAILARITKKARIVLIGNSLANRHPLRLAEELATIDLISGGRLVTGWVRGAGFNQFFNSLNPAYNREYFEEAHDFIIQAWTRPGPWRYEGKHFHYRHVNPWTLPLQKPHPPFWIPGVVSPDTIIWAAQHGYPYLSLGATPSATCAMWDLYADEAARCGRQAGSENFGCLLQTVVADTDDDAHEIGKSFYFGGGHAALASPPAQLPAGFNSPSAIKRLAKRPGRSWYEVADDPPDPGFSRARRRAMDNYAAAEGNQHMMLGTPDTVIERLTAFMEVLRPGTIVFSAPQGNVSNDVRQKSMRMLAEHVLPAIRAYGASIGLVDAFERAPGSVPLAAGAQRHEVVNRDRLVAHNYA